ncbi:PGL/p-HBAD biosynthesis glycosyltransferase/MT3031 [bacterium BMS3Abin10]|nr:PGL/p-HBAD biosynthesis glycosyltransferase/MT3031 [bacterium BMS3Abin10]
MSYNESLIPTFISMIIPVYNDSEGLISTLKSVVAQEYVPECFEIIVVDNGSTDATYQTAGDFAGQYPNLIKVLEENTVQSSYAARNKGVGIARGEILCFIDADMTVESDYLKRVARLFSQSSVDYAGCKVEVFSSDNSMLGIYGRATGFPVERYLFDDHFAPTCCLVVSRALIDKIGLFDSGLESGGDFEFGNRAYRAGFNLQYSPDIIMKHPARKSIRQLYNKALRVGRGLRQISCYHTEHFKNNRSINRNILNPVYYLPVPPWNFHRALKGNKAWDNALVREKIAIYLIYCVIERLGKQAGYIYEKLKNRQCPKSA